MVTYKITDFNLSQCNGAINDTYSNFTKNVGGIWQKELLDFVFSNYDADFISKIKEHSNINPLGDDIIVSIDYIKKILLFNAHKQWKIENCLTDEDWNLMSDDCIQIESQKYVKIIIDNIVNEKEVLIKLKEHCEKKSIYYNGGTAYFGNYDYYTIYFIVAYNDDLNRIARDIFEYYENYLDKTDSDDDYDDEMADLIEENLSLIENFSFVLKIKSYLTKSSNQYEKLVSVKNNEFVVSPITYLHDLLSLEVQYNDINIETFTKI